MATWDTSGVRTMWDAPGLLPVRITQRKRYVSSTLCTPSSHGLTRNRHTVLPARLTRLSGAPLSFGRCLPLSAICTRPPTRRSFFGFCGRQLLLRSSASSGFERKRAAGNPHAEAVRGLGQRGLGRALFGPPRFNCAASCLNSSRSTTPHSSLTADATHHSGNALPGKQPAHPHRLGLCRSMSKATSTRRSASSCSEKLSGSNSHWPSMPSI